MPSAMPVSNMFKNKKKTLSEIPRLNAVTPKKFKTPTLQIRKPSEKITIQKKTTLPSVDDSDGYISYLVGPTLTDNEKPQDIIKIIENQLRVVTIKPVPQQKPLRISQMENDAALSCEI